MTVTVVGSMPEVATSPYSIGAYPYTIMSDVSGAVEMRFGNTAAEMALAPWRPYATKAAWLARTGPGQREVHCQYRDANQDVIETTTADVPAYVSSIGPGWDAARKYAAVRAAMPASTAAKGGVGGVIWEQNFDEPGEAPHWSVYNYADPHYFYPVTHSTTGGAEGGGFISADDSRWTIDTPETPDSVLAFLTYARWHVPPLGEVNLYPSNASFYMRGRSLNLKGAQAFFWILLTNWSGKNTARWYKTSVPLDVGDGVWGAKNTININSSYNSGWTESFPLTAPQPDAADFTAIYSWGIGLRGFPSGDKPTGILDLSNFKIESI